MLFTDDGEAANALTHPSAGIEREYAVRVRGAIDNETLERMTQGILLDDGEARFDRIADAGGEGSNHWYHVILREGRRNEVRRIWEAVGCQVARLIRVRFGPIGLPRHLRAGRFEDLPRADAEALNALAGRAGGDVQLALQPLQGRRAQSRKKQGARRRRGTGGSGNRQAPRRRRTAREG
jgi:23S rRNA pseudouridine2605 synthase